MKLSPRLRWALVLTVLACLGVALTDAPDQTPVRPANAARRVVTRPAAGSASTAAPAAWPDRPTRTDPSPWPTADAHALAAWSPAAPSAASATPPRFAATTALPASATPPAPVAPPFPYQLIGRFDDGGASQALLLGATQTLGVRAGDVVDGQWRVEAVDGAGVSLTWIPAGLRQTLNFRPS